MTQADHEFGRVGNLTADAVGEPGHRRFRLLVESRDGRAANLWMEKEQLFNLAVALKRIFATMEQEMQENATGQSFAEEQGDLTTGIGGISYPIDFDVTQLAVGYDEQIALFTIAAYTEDTEEESGPVVRFTAVWQEVDVLADVAFEVCAAGRPRCAVCGEPIGPERHNCPRQNGHRILEY